MVFLFVLFLAGGSLVPAVAQQNGTPPSTTDPQSSTGGLPVAGAATPGNEAAASSGPAPANAADASSPGALPASALSVSKGYPGSRSLPDLLGLTLDEAFASFGAPEELFPLRGDEAWQDDVVFYYPDHSYLFWYKDRVWQVRVDRRFAESALGLSMGESMDEVEQSLGPPFHVEDSSLIFILPDRGYPVRARLFFESDRLVDLYVFRADF